MTDPHSLAFFLGGRDLEMVAIRELLDREAPDRVFDRGLSWGAKASAYREEIARAIEAAWTPVLVELEDDLGVPGAIVVDHHGEASVDAPSSLDQVFRLLQLPRERWTRWHALVAANDGGYIPAMRRLGATDEEIRAIRAADRAAQGITAADEAAAESAVREAEWRANGRLLVVRLPHARTATVMDRLAERVPQPENVIVLSPDEVNVYGRRELVRRLEAHYGGWSGGSDRERGFWGHAPAPAGVLEFVESALAPSASD